MGNCSSTKATEYAPPPQNVTRPERPAAPSITTVTRTREITIRKQDFEYKGETKNDIPHGVGLIQWHDGENYKGTFRNGSMEGKGVYRYRNGSVYDGDWQNGERNGFGRKEDEDGYVYEGEWKNNCRHGKGITTWKTG